MIYETGFQYVPLPTLLLSRDDIDIQDRVILAAIMDDARLSGRGFSRLTNAEVAVRCGLSRSKVARAMRRLASKGFIRCDFRADRRVRLRIHPAWSPEQDARIGRSEEGVELPGLWTKHADLPDWRRYELYINSNEWSIRRDAVWRRAKGVCERCQAAPMGEVHHLTYDRKYVESLDDLMGLCIPCHRFVHNASSVDPILVPFETVSFVA